MSAGGFGYREVEQAGAEWVVLVLEVRVAGLRSGLQGGEKGARTGQREAGVEVEGMMLRFGRGKTVG